MKTPLAKRWPVPVALGVAGVIAGVVSHVLWIRLVVFLVVLVAAAIVLRFAAGWPWSRILSYREPD